MIQFDKYISKFYSTNKIVRYVILWCIAICYLFFFSPSTSPYNDIIGADSAIFKIMGMGILEGKVPYHDIFDHKGPILFFIEALGIFINNGKLGLLLLQSISLSITIAILYKISRLFTTIKKTIISVCLGLFVLVGLIGEGNQCEEWELPFLSITLYIGIKYCIQRTINNKELFFIGICSAMVFFNRMNDTAMIIAIFITCITIVIQNRNWKLLKNAFIFIFTGFAIIAIPIIIYFVINSALQDLYYGMVEHNILYKHTTEPSIKEAFLTHLPNLFFLISLILLSNIYDKGNNTNTTIFSILILPLYFFTIGARGFEHYYIVTIPVLVLTFALAFRMKQSVVCITVLLPYLAMSLQIAAIRIHSKDRENIKPMIADCDKWIKLIPEKERDSIWCYNLLEKEFDVYVHINHTPLNRIFVCSHFIANRKLEDEEYKRFYQIKPKWVLYSKKDEEFRKGYVNKDLSCYKVAYSSLYSNIILLQKK